MMFLNALPLLFFCSMSLITNLKPPVKIEIKIQSNSQLLLGGILNCPINPIEDIIKTINKFLAAIWYKALLLKCLVSPLYCPVK